MSTKPIVVSFAAVKGGVGKTRYAIFTANCLGAAGKRVLFVDTDINNSASFYYLLTREERELAKDKHIAGALSKSENDFADFAIPTSHPGISIVPSSLYLTDLRSIDTNRLSRMVEHISGDYDVVIIDCQPDYNNIVLNAVNASDLIVTPVLLDLDSYNAARFLQDKINYETNQKTDNWFLAITNLAASSKVWCSPEESPVAPFIRAFALDAQHRVGNHPQARLGNILVALHTHAVLALANPHQGALDELHPGGILGAQGLQHGPVDHLRRLVDGIPDFGSVRHQFPKGRVSGYQGVHQFLAMSFQSFPHLFNKFFVHSSTLIVLTVLTKYKKFIIIIVIMYILSSVF